MLGAMTSSASFRAAAASPEYAAAYGVQWGEVGILVPQSERLGIRVCETVVESVRDDSHALGLLFPGDHIESLNFVRHASLDTLTAAVLSARPGPYLLTVRPGGPHPGPDTSSERVRIHARAMEQRRTDAALCAATTTSHGVFAVEADADDMARLQQEAPDALPQPPAGWVDADLPSPYPESPGTSAAPAVRFPGTEEWLGRGRDHRAEWLAQLRNETPPRALRHSEGSVDASPGDDDGQQRGTLQEEEGETVTRLRNLVAELDARLESASRLVTQMSDAALPPSYMPRAGQQLEVIHAATGSHGLGFTLRLLREHNAVDMDMLLVALRLEGSSVVQVVAHGGGATQTAARQLDL